MFDFLNAIYLAAILFSSITMYPEGETPVPTRVDGDAVAVNFYREWWREDGEGKCLYKGMVIPFDRTWPEEIQRGDERIVLPPEPEKLAGYVALINRKECKGKETEVILRAGLVRSRTLLFGGRGPQVDKHMFFPAGNLLETPVDKIQPWLPQVVGRLEKLSAENPKAKAFLTSSATELRKVLPQPTEEPRVPPTSAIEDHIKSATTDLR